MSDSGSIQPSKGSTSSSSLSSEPSSAASPSPLSLPSALLSIASLGAGTYVNVKCLSFVSGATMEALREFKGDWKLQAAAVVAGVIAAMFIASPASARKLLGHLAQLAIAVKR